MPDDSYERFREASRGKWGRSTPYRLGFAIGEAGSVLPSPYKPGSPAHHQFNSGLIRGRKSKAHKCSKPPIFSGLP